jgi:hypothetical protein
VAVLAKIRALSNETRFEIVRLVRDREMDAGTVARQFKMTRPAVSQHRGVLRAAQELREMYQYYEQYTYFGPEHEKRTAATNALVPGGFTGFADWAKVHMKPT